MKVFIDTNVIVDAMTKREFTIIGVEKEKLQAALKNKSFSDFEDGVQYECAISYDVDVIVTRDVKHFENSKLKVMTPHDFMDESEPD